MLNEEPRYSAFVASPAFQEYTRFMTVLRDQWREVAEKHRKNPAIRDEALDRAAWFTDLIERPMDAIEEMQRTVQNHLEAGDEDVATDLSQGRGVNVLEAAYRNIVSRMMGNRPSESRS
jgi:hypothetical protein